MDKSETRCIMFIMYTEDLDNVGRMVGSRIKSVCKTFEGEWFGVGRTTVTEDLEINFPVVPEPEFFQAMVMELINMGLTVDSCVVQLCNKSGVVDDGAPNHYQYPVTPTVNDDGTVERPILEVIRGDRDV